MTIYGKGFNAQFSYYHHRWNFLSGDRVLARANATNLHWTQGFATCAIDKTHESRTPEKIDPNHPESRLRENSSGERAQRRYWILSSRTTPRTSPLYWARLHQPCAPKSIGQKCNHSPTKWIDIVGWRGCRDNDEVKILDGTSFYLVAECKRLPRPSSIKSESFSRCRYLAHCRTTHILSVAGTLFNLFQQQWNHSLRNLNHWRSMCAVVSE